MSDCSPSATTVWFPLGLMLVAALNLSAAPDPDLFDGRVESSPPPSESSPSTEPQTASGEEAQNEAGDSEEAASDARDLSQVDGVTAGEPVAAESSKTGEASESASTLGETAPAPTSGRDLESAGQVGGGESVDVDRSKTGGSLAGGGGGGVPTKETPAGSAGGGNPTERNFEDFGFGASGGASSPVEVNQSKQASVPPSGSSTGSVPPSTANTPPKSGSGDTGGSAPAVGNASGDYGSNLPSGL